jgi:regulator of sirC expression with transglutaminase-like and TPR domain
VESLKSRPVMTCEQLCAAGSPGGIPQSSLLMAGEFLKMVRAISGRKVTRRTLQFYGSPQLRLMPKPLHFRGHRAHYLHPEHSVRFAVLLHLRAEYFLPLKLAKVVLDRLTTDRYDLILDSVLSAADIVRLARDGGPKAWLRDALVGRASRALQAARLIENGREEAAEPAEIASAMADHRKVFGRASTPAAADLLVEAEAGTVALVASQGKLGAHKPHPLS